ncbi:hypothetical protein [Streptomyces sp. NBC_00887]|uniref:hypothetical protein n=1 Tax=Streptomyces sp. NBC_00887 TaxID=2975859 RepID=UPI00386FE12F|nr:hypothetical protein OG844_10870 [Streptomyces sp. NBC_00887]
MSTSSAQDVSREAGELFRSGSERVFDDVAQRRLRYHLLRLTTVGLTETDVEDLRELGRLAFEDVDVTDKSTRIKQRADASALAVAIADILEQPPNRGSRARVMVGAVLGAYAVVGGTAAAGGMTRQDRSAAAVLGAVGGALAASTIPTVLDRIDHVGLSEYLSMQD